ncbi:MAG TPA: hypothetical protein VFV02_08470, partial [Acidimicrobiales bacterium]|nr:hypothetical protein [Acidimicrobiales bacterium]
MTVGSPAPAIAGVRPDGSRVSVELDGSGGSDESGGSGGSELLLIFLTSECRECAGIWDRLTAGAEGAVLVVTPGPETESRRKVAERSASAGSQPLTVVMSSEVWHAFGITRAPWLVEVR